MRRNIKTVQGVFSSLSIELNDDILNHLATIKKEDNPLASVEEDMKRLVRKFERAYRKAVEL